MNVDVIWYTDREVEQRAVISNRGFWDQGWVEDIFSGAWPAPYPVSYTHHYGFDHLPADIDGAIVILPSRHYVDQIADIQSRIDTLGWVMLLLTGDEESVFPFADLHHPLMHVWAQTPHPDVHSSVTGRYPEFCPPGTHEFFATLPSDREQPIDWSFLGQNNNLRRAECIEVLEQMPSPQRFLLPTAGFTLGLDRRTYLGIMAATRVVPAPSGCFTPSTFRVFEALESGAVPVVDDHSPVSGLTGYWSFVFGESPAFPVVDYWSQFPDVCAQILADWPASSNRVGAWWQGWKRRFINAFYDDLLSLSGRTVTYHPITVIVTSSPIPSHPDISILDQTIASIASRLPDAEILLCLDGVRAEQESFRPAYEEYQRRVLFKANNVWSRVTCLRFKPHVHQAEMTRVALDLIKTPLILFVEHDTPLLGDIDFSLLAQPIFNKELDVLRLYPEVSIPSEHSYLMLDQTPVDITGVPIIRTRQWSQRPHLASTEFYRRLMAEHFTSGEQAMIEDRVHGPVQTQHYDRHRIGIYAPTPDMKRSGHLDGRGDQPKWV